MLFQPKIINGINSKVVKKTRMPKGRLIKESDCEHSHSNEIHKYNQETN